MFIQKLRIAGMILLLSCLFLPGGSGTALAEVRALELLSGDVHTYVSEAHPLRRVVIGNPDIVHVDVVSKNEIILVGKKLGNTKILLRDDAGSETTLDIMVSPDITTLKKRINELFPGQNIRIYSNKSGVILAGSVTGAEIIEQVLRVANQLLLTSSDKGVASIKVAKGVRSAASKEELAQVMSESRGVTVEAVAEEESGGETGKSGPSIINLMTVGGPQQVLLEVKFAEVNRRSARDLQAGFSLGKLSDDFSYSSTSTGTASPAAAGSLLLNLASKANIFVNIDNFTATLRFLEEEQLGRILAEPKLVTMAGQEASFLAGGEYPFQEIDEDGDVGITFKEFGVGLRFTPIVGSDGLITLHVAPSVTEIASLIEVENGSNEAVFSTRKLDSTVQLHDGQTLALAGLLQDSLTEVVNKIPLLGDIPIIGTLFRSTNYLQNKTDLMIAVTPHIIQPVREGELTFPGEFINPPNRFEFYLEGRLEGRRRATDPSHFSRHDFIPGNGGLEGDFGHTDETN